MMATRSPAAIRDAAATATLLSRQKPMDWSARAWCPGGRAATKARSARPRRSSSMATSPAPAAWTAMEKVVLGVDPAELVGPGGPGRDHHQVLCETEIGESFHHRRHPDRPLGVPGLGVLVAPHRPH